MKRPAFFDTNIFLYADDKAAPKKQNQAIKLVSGHRIQGLAIVSLQVMQEYFVIATRKLGVDVEWRRKRSNGWLGYTWYGWSRRMSSAPLNCTAFIESPFGTP